MSKKRNKKFPKVLVLENDNDFKAYSNRISEIVESSKSNITLASSFLEIENLVSKESYDILLIDLDFAKLDKINPKDNILSLKSEFFDSGKSITISTNQKTSLNVNPQGYEILFKNNEYTEAKAHSLENFLRERTEILYENSIRSETSEQKQKVIKAAEEDWSKVIEHLSKNTQDLYLMPPRKFEELVAELLSRDGMEVYLTPETRDGGRDILAISNTSIGKHLFFVECKRYASNNPVDVAIVRALYGTLSANLATAGLIVTTSYFTKPAIKFQNSIKHRLSLKDYKNLEEWLKKSLG